jgi:hypothetical protein
VWHGVPPWDWSRRDGTGVGEAARAGSWLCLLVTRVIPILMEGARLPRDAELPASLANLARRQAFELSPSRFDADSQRLLSVLDQTIAERQEQARREAERAAAQARDRQRVEQLQRRIRERASAQDWKAVVTAGDELAALDPAAADPDGLVGTAREQITHRA